MAACSGGDTGIEVILEPEVEVTPEPEPIEEVIPEPEPDVETVDVPTLESWGAEYGEVNCQSPLLTKEAPFPFASNLKPYPGEWQAVGGGGPECRDDDNEGSLINADCVINDITLGPTVLQCKPVREDYCYERARTDDRIDECQIIPQDTSLIEKTGFSNFYGNLFKNSANFVNKEGQARIHKYGKRSFIMSRTHRSPSGSALAGNLHGKYNPDSEEYKDRKRLWDECGIGTDPQIGSAKEDDWRENGINGKWQAVKRNDHIEICIRLDTLPGSVKCFVDDPDGGFVNLYVNGRPYSDNPIVPTNEIEMTEGDGDLSLFNGGDFHRDQLCELFDEG